LPRRAADELFTTPGGSNDDWYWLYAAVLAGASGRLVTNDELRDHVFQMLPAPRLFYKWKERHQVTDRPICTACACVIANCQHQFIAPGSFPVHCRWCCDAPPLDVYDMHPRGGGWQLVDVSFFGRRRVAVRAATRWRRIVIHGPNCDMTCG
jgi:hypothetical protein